MHRPEDCPAFFDILAFCVFLVIRILLQEGLPLPEHGQWEVDVASSFPGPRGPPYICCFSLHDTADACDDFDGTLVGKAGGKKQGYM